MTVKEIFDKKYREWLKTITKASWENCKCYAAAKNMHIAEYMYMCLEITENDIKTNGGYNSDFYREICEAHKKKLLASNRHRQEHGHVDKWWFTKKGLKSLNVLGQ